LYKYIKKLIRNIIDYFFYPYLKVKELPSVRPSIKSIYYFINQLGKNKPVGLTRVASVAYHEVPFAEIKVKTSRNDLQKRIELISNNFEFNNKVGIDIGCAIGGVTFSLQKMGAKMIGIERDLPAFNVATEIEAYFKTGANFIHSSISPSLLEEVLKKFNHKEFDFTIWLSSFNWVLGDLGEESTKDLINSLSQKSTYLICDSAIGGKGQKFLTQSKIESNEDFVNFIEDNSQYKLEKVLGKYDSWYNRDLFLFKRVTN